MSTYGHEHQSDGQPGHAEPWYGQPQHGQPGSAQPWYGQPGHGQRGYAQPWYGQPSYVHPSYVQVPYGYAVPRPTGVVTAAVIGFIWGGFGALMTLFLLYYGVAASSFADAPGLFGDVFGAAGGVLLLTGVLALAWTVVMFVGSSWALSGRSRVPLIVGGSISIACTALLFLGGLASIEDDGVGALMFGLGCLVLSIIVVASLANSQAAAWFAGQRAVRPR